MRNAIFIAFDETHAHHAFRCLNSIEENYPDHPELLVFYNGHKPDTISKLKSKPYIRLYHNTTLPTELLDVPCHKDVQSSMVFYKFLIWNYMFLEYDNILHLDVDTLIRAPLDRLMEKKDFFIVRNNLNFKEVQVLYNPGNYKGAMEMTLNKHGLVMPEQEDMVNAGVFVIPKSYRTANQHHLLLSLIRAFAPYVKYADQSILSLWCMKNKIQISDEYQYNFQMPVFNKRFTSRYKGNLDVGMFFSKRREVLSHIDIIHFSGPIKPDTREFLSWKLMGRYAKLFSDCYYHYGSYL